MADGMQQGSDRSRRIDEALAEYLKAADAGRPPDPAAFAAGHPELAPELGRALADLGLIEGLVAPVRPEPIGAHSDDPARTVSRRSSTAPGPEARSGSPLNASTTDLGAAPASKPDQAGPLRRVAEPGRYALRGEIARGGM